MKKTFRLLSLALCFVTNFAVAADLRIEDPQSYADLRDKTFTPLFEALRAGDVVTIRRYLSGSTYEKHRVLLEQNKEYGNFLRNYYSGATFELSQVLSSDNGYIADVFIYWPTGRTSLVQLQVRNTYSADQGTNGHSAQSKAAVQTLWTVGEPAGGAISKRKR